MIGLSVQEEPSRCGERRDDPEEGGDEVVGHGASSSGEHARHASGQGVGGRI